MSNRRFSGRLRAAAELSVLQPEDGAELNRWRDSGPSFWPSELHAREHPKVAATEIDLTRHADGAGGLRVDNHSRFAACP